MANTKNEIRAVRKWRDDVLKIDPTAIISWCWPDYEGERGSYMVNGRQDKYDFCPECDYIKGIETGSGKSMFEDKLHMIKQSGINAFYQHKSKKSCNEKHPRRIAAWMEGWDEAKAEYDNSWED